MDYFVVDSKLKLFYEAMDAQDAIHNCPPGYIVVDSLNNLIFQNKAMNKLEQRIKENRNKMAAMLNAPSYSSVAFNQLLIETEQLQALLQPVEDLEQQNDW